MDINLTPVILSLKIAIIAVIAISLIAIPLARIMQKYEFPGKDIVEAIITLPLVLPPTVIGFGLLFLFGKNGPLGQFLSTWFNIRVVFTWWGAVIAAATVAFPLMYQSVKAAFDGVDLTLEKAARTLGASEFRIFCTITMPLAWPGILAGFVLTFARALGEFGATLMIAGNIPGQTQTIPLAVFFAVESGEISKATGLVAIMVLICFGIIFWQNKWVKTRRANLHRG
jgi:molybdate transport system permease protein